MLYEAILLGCEKYHQAPYSYDDAYREYRNDRDEDKWSNPKTLDYSEVDRLILFVNQWGCMMPREAHDNVERLREGLKRQIPGLDRLKDYTLLNVELDEATRKLIAESFHAVANAGCRFESVATSKMLHAAVNPELFVMWDNCIMHGYEITYGNGRAYAHHFLPKMQLLARESMRQARDSQVEPYPPAGHTMAKVIDEYNYVRFTLRNKEVRKMADRL